MLFDEKLFQIVEQECIKQGVIADFEKDNGKITGRMNIPGLGYHRSAK